MASVVAQQLMSPVLIAFDVCKSPSASVLRDADVYEPWWENGMLFATDGVMAVASPYQRPEYVGPGCGIHLFNRAIPARRLPELLPLFALDRLKLRTEPVAIPPGLKPWSQCPCAEEAETKGYCQDCEGGWLPILDRCWVRPGPFPVSFQTRYLAMLGTWGVDKINLIPGAAGMTEAAYFRCGTLLGCVQPMAPGEK
jgi:hypothetical protein